MKMTTKRDDERNFTKAEVLDLMGQKAAVEKEMGEWALVLEQEKGVGMNETLVDEEGFPRNDVDVHKVRQARNRIICLRNDLKNLMSQIEQGLHSLHRQSRDGVGPVQEVSSLPPDSEEPLTPDDGDAAAFAWIDSVAPGSPAHEAGLQVGDRLLTFGTVNRANFGGDLRTVSNIVESCANGHVRVEVLRRSELPDKPGNKKHVVLTLEPRRWAGRGLLGCNIKPLDEGSLDR